MAWAEKTANEGSDTVENALQHDAKQKAIEHITAELKKRYAQGLHDAEKFEEHVKRSLPTEAKLQPLPLIARCSLLRHRNGDYVEVGEPERIRVPLGGQHTSPIIIATWEQGLSGLNWTRFELVGLQVLQLLGALLGFANSARYWRSFCSKRGSARKSDATPAADVDKEGKKD